MAATAFASTVENESATGVCGLIPPPRFVLRVSRMRTANYSVELCNMSESISARQQLYGIPSGAPPIGVAALPPRCQALKHMIGNTPLLRIRFRYHGQERMIYAKAEHLNLTGSIKDRMAFHILKRAYQENRIDPNDTIAEATSGNTGISFAAIGRALGHQVVIFMPDWMSQERVSLIKSLGARIIPVRRDQGGFVGSIRMTEELAENRPHVFLPAQFANEANVEAHAKATGPEIWWQLYFHSLRPDAFIAGVGTGGTIMGVGKYLRQRNPGVKLHPLQPTESPTLSTGHKVGHHRIQGISDEFIPSILQLEELDAVVSIK